MISGIIYCIKNSIDDEVYVGSTTESLHKRMIKHKCDMKRFADKPLYSKMNELGFDKFNIELLEEIKTETRHQLRIAEGRYIVEIGTLNVQKTGRPLSEWRKEWRQINREHLVEKKREWNKEHRVENNEKRRERYHANREVENAASKTWKENNREHCNQYKMDYYYAHHEEQLKKRSEYREKNREHINAVKKAWSEKKREQLQQPTVD